MATFNKDKNGYKIEEVDSYIQKIELEYQHELEEKRERINFLKNKLEETEKELKKFKAKDENISIAMIGAVEKAKQMEETSSNMYKLKLQQLNILYNRWENLLNNSMEKYPELKVQNQEIKDLVKDFKKSIDSTLKAHSINPVSETSNSNDKIKVLLNKMNSYFEKRRVGNELDSKLTQKNEKKLESLENPNKIEEEMKSDKQPIIKPISSINIEEGENFESIADKYLNSEEVSEQGVFKTSEEKSEFDLKEAVNPKDDLAEIMKAFDFFE